MQLPNKTLEFLKQCLAEPGWNKEGKPGEKSKRFYLAGKCLAEVLPEQTESPIPPTEAASRLNPSLVRSFVSTQDTWAKELSSNFELDAKTFETCQVCLRFFIEEDRMPKGLFGLKLYEAFKLGDE